MNPDTKAMQDILDKLSAASKQSAPSTVAKSQSRAPATGNVSPAAVEMLNILTKLESAATTAATNMVTEHAQVKPAEADQQFGVGKYNVVLEKSSVAGFAKTYYTITDNGVAEYEQLALFESAMAIIKIKLFSNNADRIAQIVDLDRNYASALHEAASYKNRLASQTLNESKQDVLSAKHSGAVARMQSIKKQIKTLL